MADWPAPDYWCTICDRGAEGCHHEPIELVDHDVRVVDRPQPPLWMGERAP